MQRNGSRGVAPWMLLVGVAVLLVGAFAYGLFAGRNADDAGAMMGDEGAMMATSTDTMMASTTYGSMMGSSTERTTGHDGGGMMEDGTLNASGTMMY